MNFAAVLERCHLEKGMIGQSKQDEVATASLAVAEGVDVKAVKASRRFFVETLAPIKTAWGKVYATHISSTFAGIADERWIVATEHDRYVTRMDEEIAKAITVRSDWIAAYPDHIEVERKLHKDKFKLADYPSPEELVRLFKLEYIIQPVADPTQFFAISALNSGYKEALAQKNQREMKTRIESITRGLFNEGLGLVKAVHEVLKNPDKRLCDSDAKKGPVAKLREWAARVPQVNMENDPMITELCQQVDSELTLISDVLRESTTIRAVNAVRAATILDKYSGGYTRKILD